MFLAQSNQGNHTGINRHWSVSSTPNTDLMFIAEMVGDKHSFYSSEAEFSEVFGKERRFAKWEGAGIYNSSGELEANESTRLYEHDFVYYILFDDEVELDDVENDGHYSGLRDRIAELRLA